MSMFVSMLVNTVVNTSLPVIVADLGGSQSTLTWVITATLLATTVSTPIWGKLSDLFPRKIMMQTALVLFTVASAVAGLAQDPGLLIAMRALQGVGAGGLMALSQIVMADVVSPRDRGRYAGMFGAVTAIGTMGGPLLGGFITGALDWRWNFYLAMPFAIVAFILLQKWLHLPQRSGRTVTLDYLGIVLIAGGVSLLLLWVSLGGEMFARFSGTGVAMIAGSVLLLVLAVWWELRAPEPLIPLTLFRNRTFTLAVLASLSVGVAMFATAAFLAQYMQLARGATPLQSGLMTTPMMGSVLLTSTIVGAVISRTGHWKRYLVTGSVLMSAGLLALSFLRYDTPFVLVAVAMAVLGTGVGMVMQNLMVVTQNSVEWQNMGVATSTVTFFRSLAGTLAVSGMGAVLASSVSNSIAAGASGIPESEAGALRALQASGAVPNVSELPEQLQTLVESSYGVGIGRVFAVALPVSLLAIIATALMPNQPLSRQSGIERSRAEIAETGAVGPVASETIEAVKEDSTPLQPPTEVVRRVADRADGSLRAELPQNHEAVPEIHATGILSAPGLRRGSRL